MASDLYKSFNGYPHFCSGQTTDRPQIQPKVGQILACQSRNHVHLLVFGVIESQTKGGKFRIKELNRVAASSKPLFVPGTVIQDGPGWLASFDPDKHGLVGTKGWHWWQHEDGLEWTCKCCKPCSKDCDRCATSS
jgi:hypothetical protein